MKRKPSLPLLLSVVFMDMVGFGFIIPILPDYLERMAASPVFLGIALASYALGQFISAPIVGRLSDRFGRKPLLMMSIGGTMASLLLLGFARSVELIILSRLLDGLTGGNITVAQAYVADITKGRERAKGLGMIGAAFGMGFIFGPLFGALLVGIDLYAPPFAAAAMAGINLLLIAFILPESRVIHKPDTTAEPGGRKKSLLSDFGILLLQKDLSSSIFMLFFYSLGFNMFQSMFSPHAMLVFNLSPQKRGYLLAYIGVIIAIAQGFLISRLVNRFREDQLLYTANWLLAASLFAWAFSPSVPVLMLVMVPMAISGGLQGVLLRSRISQRAPEALTGASLGLTASVESLNRIIAPTLGGVLLSALGSASIGTAAGISLLIGGIVFLSMKNLNEPASQPAPAAIGTPAAGTQE